MPVVLLTVHPSEELAVEAGRAGIEAVIEKSDGNTLAALLERIARQTVHLAGSAVRRIRHIGAFFASEADKYQILAPFCAEGVSHGERAFHIVNGAERQMHAARFAEAGLDLEDAAWQRCSEVVAWDEMYLAAGRFDQQAMLERFQRVLAESAEAGFRATRLVANMEWALERMPGVDDLAEYESRVNYIDPLFPNVIVCAYDVRNFNAGVIVDVMRAHPAIVVGGSLFENQFYVQPDELIGELTGRRMDL
jgi:hypothetical protein